MYCEINKFHYYYYLYIYKNNRGVRGGDLNKILYSLYLNPLFVEGPKKAVVLHLIFAQIFHAISEITKKTESATGKVFQLVLFLFGGPKRKSKKTCVV